MGRLWVKSRNCFDNKILIRSFADTSVLALAGFIVWFALHIVAKDHYGAGRHSWDLPPEYYNGYITVGIIPYITKSDPMSPLT